MPGILRVISGHFGAGKMQEMLVALAKACAKIAGFCAQQKPIFGVWKECRSWPERLEQLEDETAEKDRRIAELKDEIDKQRDLIQRQSEQCERDAEATESWVEAFEIKIGDDGKYQVDWDVPEGTEWYDLYMALLRRWNTFVPNYNAAIGHGRNIGRPLEASEVQVEEVRRLRKSGFSLREIVDDTSLSFSTVRTIVGRAAGTDRTTRKHLERIAPDRAAAARWKRIKRTRDAMPQQIAALEKERGELRTEVRGLGHR